MTTSARESDDASGDLKSRISQTLDELRVVLPGTQALLGFQFVAFFQQYFQELGDRLKYAHLASLLLIVLTTMLLMWPAAYHRIVEGGRDSERFHRFASRVLVGALAVLALGLSVDLYVVVEIVTGSWLAAVPVAASCCGCFYGGWFAFTAARHLSRADASPRMVPTA